MLLLSLFLFVVSSRLFARTNLCSFTRAPQAIALAEIFLSANEAWEC